MRKIDRLIIKAKLHIAKVSDKLEMAFIEKAGKGYIISCHIMSNGKLKDIITCGYSSLAKAYKAIDEISEKYPNDKDIIIYVNDGLGD